MNYAQIRKYDIANGEGVRTSLFVSGCNFNCKNCFNKKYQNFLYGEQYTSQTLEQIYKYLKNPQVDGLSILGGDSLCQNVGGLIELKCLCDIVHKLNKNVWLWSGYIFEQIIDNADNAKSKFINLQQKHLLSNVDVFIDGAFIDDLRDLKLKWRGSSNQRVIDVNKSLKENKTVLYCD